LFFALVFALSIPFYFAGARTKLQILPGLPVSAFAFVCPGVAALLLVARERGVAGVVALLGRVFDWGRIQPKTWLLPTVALNPGATLSAYALMRFLNRPLPVWHVEPGRVVLLFVALAIAAMAEELGWSGYALEPLEARWNALASGVLLGLVWAVWHWIPLLEVDRPASWIAWWFLGSVAARVLMTWLFNSAGKSVFGAAVFHTSINLSWQLFPNEGSYWDPRLNALIVTALAVAVTVMWGPRTLARFRIR
jgi:uncharacterized protein